MRQERFEEAKKSLKTAAGLEPDKPYVLFLLGMAYHMLGDKEKAKESLSKAHELAPNLPSPNTIMPVLSGDCSGDATL